MYSLVGLQTSLITSPATLGVTVPAVESDGVDVTSWKTGRMATPYAVVLFEGSATATLSSLVLWGYINGKWYRLGVLASGGDLPIAGSPQGAAEELQHVGVATRLAVTGATTAGTVTYKFGPLEVRQ